MLWLDESRFRVAASFKRLLDLLGQTPPYLAFLVFAHFDLLVFMGRELVLVLITLQKRVVLPVSRRLSQRLFVRSELGWLPLDARGNRTVVRELILC